VAGRCSAVSPEAQLTPLLSRALVRRQPGGAGAEEDAEQHGAARTHCRGTVAGRGAERPTRLKHRRTPVAAGGGGICLQNCAYSGRKKCSAADLKIRLDSQTAAAADRRRRSGGRTVCEVVSIMKLS
jgi:hypothetical protein